MGRHSILSGPIPQQNRTSYASLIEYSIQVTGSHVQSLGAVVSVYQERHAKHFFIFLARFLMLLPST